MKTKRIIIMYLCLISGIVISPAQVKLSFSPKEGTNYEFLTEIRQNIRQSAMGRELLIEEDVTMSHLMNVKSMNASATEALFTCQNASYFLSSPMMKMGYDPKKPNANPSPLDKVHEKIIRSLIGRSFTMSIATDGSVKSVSGIDAIIEEIKKSVAPDGEMGAQLSASEINQWYGESAIKGLFEQSLRIFPAGEVKTGDSWTVETNYGISNKKSTVKSVYTLKEVKDDKAVIGVEATVNLEPDGGLTGTLTGTQSGTVLVDTKTGIPVSSDLTLDIKGTLKTQQGEMQMTMVAKMKTATKEVR